jgi:hypothetical protein
MQAPRKPWEKKQGTEEVQGGVLLGVAGVTLSEDIGSQSEGVLDHEFPPVEDNGEEDSSVKDDED